MNRYVTKGIILARTNYGEADRILTFLTPDYGKFKAMARGVRKVKAKLAGSTELFSVSNITIIPGRREIDTLASARLVKHYGNIVKDIDRTRIAYEFLKLINKNTQDRPEPGYFNLLQSALAGLDDNQIDPQLTDLWFNLQLLKLAGHAPNFKTDSKNDKLIEDKKYVFNYTKMSLQLSSAGKIGTNEIKLLRLLASAKAPVKLNRSDKGIPGLDDCSSLVEGIAAFFN